MPKIPVRGNLYNPIAPAPAPAIMHTHIWKAKADVAQYKSTTATQMQIQKWPALYSIPIYTT